MSDPVPDPQTPPAEDPPAGKKKGKMAFFDQKGKFRPSSKMIEAVDEINRRKRLELKLEYKQVGLYFGVKPESLRQCVSLDKAGKLDRTRPPDAVEKLHERQNIENERMFNFTMGYEHYLLLRAESVLDAARKHEIKKHKDPEAAETESDTFRRKLRSLADDITTARRLRNVVEKGLVDRLQEVLQMQKAQDDRASAQQNSKIEITGPVTMTQNNLNVTNGAPPPAVPPAMHAIATNTSEQERMRQILAGSRQTNGQEPEE
jgi:hypothetical protein